VHAIIIENFKEITSLQIDNNLSIKNYKEELSIRLVREANDNNNRIVANISRLKLPKR